MKHTIQFHVFKGEKQYVAQGLDLPIVTQAPTLDELAKNIQEAVALHLEDADLESENIDSNASVLFNVELPSHV